MQAEFYVNKNLGVYAQKTEKQGLTLVRSKHTRGILLLFMFKQDC